MPCSHRAQVTSSARDCAQLQRMRLRVRCAAPVIVLPVSGRRRDALAAELTLLQLDNRFCRAGDPHTVSKLVDPALGERPPTPIDYTYMFVCYGGMFN